MVCSKCGAEIRDDDVFCGACGTPQKQESTSQNVDLNQNTHLQALSDDLSPKSNTVESVTLDYISQNKPPSYYAYGDLITPKLLKKYRVNLEVDEKPLLMLKSAKGLSDNASCKSSITITNKKIHYMTPKKGLAFGYLSGSFDILNLESLNFGSKRNTMVKELYIGHPLLINGKDVGLIQFCATFKEEIKDCLDEGEKKYSDNISLNYILGLFDAFAAGGIIKNPVEKKSWNEDDSPRNFFMNILRFVWSIFKCFAG